MAGKCSDMSAAFACSSCHDLYDKRDSRWVEHKEHFEFYARRAILRTHHILINDGIIIIKG